tara:strand:+ start:6535 stop:7101 length:567 start_codon:yes stop_codon:yes gene_type:complete
MKTIAMPSITPVLVVIAALIISTSISFAQVTGLPGNASNLREGHGDWQVACAAPGGTVLCAMSQTQLGENGQRVLSIELTIGDDSNGANGTLVMPFGLDLASGVAYRIDERNAGTAQPFRTCLPMGCVVDVTFDTDMVAALRSGNQLSVTATVDGGQELIFSVSLAGFSSAFNRVVALMRGQDIPSQP